MPLQKSHSSGPGIPGGFRAIPARIGLVMESVLGSRINLDFVLLVVLLKSFLQFRNPGGNPCIPFTIKTQQRSRQVTDQIQGVRVATVEDHRGSQLPVLGGEQQGIGSSPAKPNDPDLPRNTLVLLEIIEALLQVFYHVPTVQLF